MNTPPERPDVEVITPGALELIQRAEIDMQIATAKRYPRDLPSVRKRMESYATLDEETAESCFYMVPRDGKQIFGPSVRLAEIALVCYQNIRAASRVIGNNGRVISAQAACLDLENNVLISVEHERRITGKNGKTFSEDMQITTGNAAVSIALRNAVFRVVPGALVKPVYEKAMQVARGTAATLKVKREKLIARFNELGINTVRVLRRLNRKSIETIDLEDVLIMVGLGTSIKDGNISAEEAFPFEAANDHKEDQMRRQADDARREADQKTTSQQTTDAPKDAPKTTSNGNTSTNPTGLWPNRDAMLADFGACKDQLGDMIFYAICGQNGIDGEDAMNMTDPATAKCYGELQKAVQQMNGNGAARTEDETLQFGKKNRR